MVRDSGHPPDPFSSLRALYAKIEAHWDRATAGTSIACTQGCVSCCHTSLTVCRVEADFILFGGRAEGEGDDGEDGRAGPRLRWVLGPPEVAPCPFLTSRGLCRIYPVRPLICRSHGIPVSADGVLDVCPANRHLVDTAPPLNLELLNTLLFAIDSVYCRNHGVDPGRVSLATLAARLIG